MPGSVTEPRPEKVAVVDEVRTRLSSASAAILTEYRGLKVHELAALRRAVNAAGGDYRIYKNTLVRLATSDLGLPELEALLVGPTAITFVEGDAVMVAKALRDFAKTHPALAVKGGLMGTSVLSAADAGALADVAPREVLLAQLAGALAAPMRQMASLLAALPRNLAYGIKALIEERGGVPDEEVAPAPKAEAAAAAADVSEAEPDAAAEPVPAEADAAPAADPEPAVADEAASATPAADPEPEPASEPEPPTASEAEPVAAAPEGDAPTDAPTPDSAAERIEAAVPEAPSGAPVPVETEAGVGDADQPK